MNHILIIQKEKKNKNYQPTVVISGNEYLLAYLDIDEFNSLFVFLALSYVYGDFIVRSFQCVPFSI